MATIQSASHAWARQLHKSAGHWPGGRRSRVTCACQLWRHRMARSPLAFPLAIGSRCAPSPPTVSGRVFERVRPGALDARNHSAAMGQTWRAGNRTCSRACRPQGRTWPDPSPERGPFGFLEKNGPSRLGVWRSVLGLGFLPFYRSCAGPSSGSKPPRSASPQESAPRARVELRASSARLGPNTAAPDFGPVIPHLCEQPCRSRPPRHSVTMPPTRAGRRAQ